MVKLFDVDEVIANRFRLDIRSPKRMFYGRMSFGWRGEESSIKGLPLVS